MKVNSDPEVGVLAPFALENLDRISTSNLCLAVPCPSSARISRIFFVKVNSDPEVDQRAVSTSSHGGGGGWVFRRFRRRVPSFR